MLLDIPELKGKSCLFSSLKIISWYFKLELPEYIIHSLSCGWEVKYESGKQDSSPFKFPVIDSVVTQFTQNCGLSLIKYTSFDIQTDYEYLLSQGNIFLLIISPSILPDMKRKFDLEIQDEKHAVILYGINNGSYAQIYEPYLVNEKGQIENKSYKLQLEELSSKVKESYCIGINNGIMIRPEKALEIMKRKIQRFFDITHVDGKPFGYNACLQLIKDMKDEKITRHQYVLLAFTLKTNFYYVYDYMLEILNDYKNGLNQDIIDDIQHQKNNWNQVYYQLLRKGYNTRKVISKDETTRVISMLHQSLLSFKTLIDILLERIFGGKYGKI